MQTDQSKRDILIDYVLIYIYTYHIKILYVECFDSDDCQMIYNLIISLLIEKPFYLLRPQSFSFQIVSEFIDTFVNFLTLCPGGGAFDFLFCPEGRVFVQNGCPGGEGFCSLQVVSRGGGMVLDETNTCINLWKRKLNQNLVKSL